jgi:dolichol-phosphate mannosyltransferase
VTKRAIVTGGTGFVGANLVRRLLADGHEVHLLVRVGYNPWRIEALRADVRLHEVDAGNRQTLGDLLATIRADWIFHLAAHGAYPHQDDVSQMVQTNVLATVNLVDAAVRAGFEAFVGAGSSSEYGFKDHAPKENEALEPNSAYAVTKAAATLYGRYVGQTAGVNVTTLRLYSVYGPYEEPTRLMPRLLVKSLANSLPPLVDPDVAHDYVYVDDVNDAFVAAATAPNPGAVYNIGSGLQTSLREVVGIVRRLRKLTVEPQWGTMPRRHGDTTTWMANNERAQSELGWQPRVDLERGIGRMAKWFDDNPSIFDRYRIEG